MTLLWLAAAVAFSPSLVDLVGRGTDLPRDRVSFALATILFLRAAFLARSEAPTLRHGAVLLVLAVALQVFGILGHAATLGAMSVALAIVGISRFTGRPPLAASLLALWLVPIPVSLLESVRAGLENGAATWVAAVASLFGSTAEAVGPVVRLEGAAMEFQAADAGVQLAHLLSLLGWYAAAVRSGSLPRCLRNAAVWGGLGLLLALPLLAGASIALVASGPRLARGLLDHVFPLAVAGVGFLVAERGRQHPV